MKPTKKKGTKKSEATDDRAKLTEEFTNKGPMRLRKYAITGLSIPANVVDGWNDFDYMVQYCVAKALGESVPGEPDNEEEEGSYEEGSEFDASSLTGEAESEEPGFDDEMEGGGDGMFADPEETPEEPPPEKSLAPAKKRSSKPKKSKAPAPPMDENDITVQLSGLLDVITNQGVVLDKLSKLTAAQESTIREIYIRQGATHKALSSVAKAVFSISTMVREFVPRALKAMRFKPATSKDIKASADAAGVNAEQLIESLLDPEAD